MLKDSSLGRARRRRCDETIQTGVPGYSGFTIGRLLFLRAGGMSSLNDKCENRAVKFVLAASDCRYSALFYDVRLIIVSYPRRRGILLLCCFRIDHITRSRTRRATADLYTSILYAYFNRAAVTQREKEPPRQIFRVRVRKYFPVANRAPRISVLESCNTISRQLEAATKTSSVRARQAIISPSRTRRSRGRPAYILNGQILSGACQMHRTFTAIVQHVELYSTVVN